MSNCKIDIIIPTYNSGNSIAAAIESILNNNFGDVKIIVVDDGSTDNTEKIINSYRINHHIKYIKQHNSGPAAARNKGIRSADNPYIAFLDADDLWLPLRIEKTFTFLKTGNFDWVATGFLKSYPTGNQEYRSFPDNYGIWNNSTGEVKLTEKGLIFFSLLPIWTGTLLFRREILEKLNGFNENLFIGEDWDLYLRAAISGCRLGFLDEPTAIYNYVPSSLTKSKKIDGVHEHLLIARKYAKKLSQSNKIITSSYAQFIWEAGRVYLEQKKIIKASWCFIKSLSIEFNTDRAISVLNKIRDNILKYISQTTHI